MSSPSLPTLVLLPGWAMAPSALAPLAAALKTPLPDWTVECAALPSLSDDALEAWLDELDDRLPDHAWLAGWSLGGMLAMALSARRGSRCPGVITLGSNLSFITRRDWGCALPPATLAAFRARWASAPEATLSRFIALIARGSTPPYPMIRQLEAHAMDMNVEQALAGLSLLQHIDLCSYLTRAPCPGLHLFAEFDALVPVSACTAISERLPENSRVHQLSDTGHAFPLEHPEQCARRMAAFIERHGKRGAHDC